MTTRAKLSMLVMVALLLPFSASASIFQQTDSSATQSNWTGSSVYMNIGDGATYNTQTLTSITIKVSATSTINNGVTFTINGYRKSDGVNDQFIAPNNGNGSAGVAWFNVASGDNTLTATYNSFTFDSSHCYTIQIQSGFSSAGRNVKGSSSATYDPGGSCFSASTGGTPNIINATGLTAAYFILATNGSTPPVNLNTRIDTTTPTSGSTIATSTAATVGATGYINPADFQTGMYIRLRYTRFSNYQAATANPDNLYTSFNFPISSAGDFTVSTTTPITNIGQYQMLVEMRKPSYTNSILNFLGFGQFANVGIQTATSTTFTADHASGYDVFVASTTASINDYLASSTISMASCSNWTSFSLTDCLNLLFIPQTQPIGVALNNFKNQFLTYAPWGYFTRTFVILSGSATTTLPNVSITYPLGDPATTMEMHTFTLDTTEMLQGGSDMISNVHTSFGDDKTLREVTEPMIQLVVGMSVIMGILYHFLGFIKGGGMVARGTGGKLS